MNEQLMNTYARLPVSFERGEGPWLWDSEGQRYLDALSGIAVCGLGHAHPAITQAVCEQAGKLTHTSNLYGIDAQSRLATKLCSIANMDVAFFCNSGAEANEAAIKLARLNGHHDDIKNPAIVVMENSFHGRTLATLTATGNRKVQAGFEPLVPGFIRAPYNDLEALDIIAQNNQEVVAVLLEPVQGEGGIRIPDQNYLADVRQFCDQHGWLMLLDEVQSGVGRTGKWFSFQHSNAVPDVLCVAKGLGNGFPIGACLARGDAARVFLPGTHGTTFGGNPVACEAALAVINVIEKESLCKQASELGQYLLTGFKERLAGLAGVSDIRGHGLMIGIELDKPCTMLVAQALQQRLLINVTANNVIRLLPPLIITPKEASTIVDIVSTLVQQFLTANSSTI